MENSPIYQNRLLVLGLLVFVLLSLVQPWGFYGHKKINHVAVFTLPPNMFGFYKANLLFVTEHAVDPDKRRYAVQGEAERHYIDLDHYGVNAFDSLPHHWKDAVAKYTEDTLQAYGILPWQIGWHKLKLQKAFEEKNVDAILKYSAEIGHYLGDAHVPLHTTENYNGQLTNQRGIHGLWESRLVELEAENFDLFTGKARYIEDLSSFVWQIIKESHLAVDSVLRLEKEISENFPADKKYTFETRGATQVKTYSTFFCAAYHEALNKMVERRMRAAIYAIGSVWMTAWVDAGQPNLNELKDKKMSAEALKKLEEMDRQFHQNNQHHSRYDEVH
ncbi:MAG: zinc dependent phospholipase C family protein [Crocinitomicaceae bacterium]|jgi:hypothetical protein|nr:zinc dependent phospholipase C family protein [Crocinitomicaceae bacterium]